MTEQEHRDRVERWLSEDEPTAFGKAVTRLAGKHGFESPLHLVAKLDPDHQRALSDHLGGIDNRELETLPGAVAHAAGVDPGTASGEDLRDLVAVARAWTFNEFAVA